MAETTHQKKLKDHLKMTLIEDADRAVPINLLVETIVQKVEAVWENPSADLVALNKKNEDKKEAMKIKANDLKDGRELDGVGDRCENLQQSRPMKIDETLVGERLEVLVECKLDEGGVVNHWCAGEVLEVSNGSNVRDPSKVRTMFKEGEAVWMK